MFAFFKIIAAIGKLLRRLVVALYGNIRAACTGKFRRKSDEIQDIFERRLRRDAYDSGAAFWEDVDYGRNNGLLCRQVSYLLLPQHDPDKQKAMVNQFVDQLMAGKRLPYTLEVRRDDSRTEGRNPHRHQIFSERVERPPHIWFRKANPHFPDRGGTRKTASTKPKQWFLDASKAQAKFVKDVLAKEGSDARNDAPSPDE